MLKILQSICAPMLSTETGGGTRRYIFICAEVIVAAVIGLLVAVKSSWWDFDAVINPGWYPILLIIGLLFGLFGRCPILVLAPAIGWTGLFAGIEEILQYGFSAEYIELYAFLCGLMSGIVVIGATTGRFLRKCWKARRLNVH